MKVIILLLILLFSGCQEFYPKANRASATSHALKGRGGFERTTLPLDYDKLASDLEKQRP
jgi:hypothetical protein